MGWYFSLSLRRSHLDISQQVSEGFQKDCRREETCNVAVYWRLLKLQPQKKLERQSHCGQQTPQILLEQAVCLTKFVMEDATGEHELNLAQVCIAFVMLHTRAFFFFYDGKRVCFLDLPCKPCFIKMQSLAWHQSTCIPLPWSCFLGVPTQQLKMDKV